MKSANRRWWSTGPLLGYGQRVGFSGSELVWQFYPGHGLQIQWLGTFGKLNWLARTMTKRRGAQASRLVDDILPLASWRAGGWELSRGRLGWWGTGSTMCKRRWRREFGRFG